VMDLTGRLNQSLPEGMSIEQSYNAAVFIEASIAEVYKTLFIAIGCVIFVIYLFLGSFRAMLIPAVIYGVMFFGMKFPPTERVASGVSNADMFKETLRPLFLFMAFCMLITSSTELSTNQWIAELLSNVGVPGILILVWINGLMAVGRNFAGPVVHRLSPPGMLLFSAVFSTLGLLWLSAASGMTALAAAAVFAVGICYFWPTMLGFVAEYVPKSGALGLAVMGGIGAASTAITQPLVGKMYDAQLEANNVSGIAIQALRGAVPGTPEHSQWLEVQAAAGSGSLRTIAILPAMLIVLTLFRGYIFAAMRKGTFSRWMGAPLVLMYVGYLIANAVLSRG